MFFHFFVIISYVLKIFKTKIFKPNAIQLLDALYIDSAAVYNDDEVQFLPPAFMQRYCTTHEILAQLKSIYNIKKVIDIGCSEMSLFTHIKRLEGVEEYIAVDIDLPTLKRCRPRVEPLQTEFLNKRTSPFKVSVLHGSAVLPDKRLKHANVVVAIELIEHMYPPELDDLPYNIFGLIQPEIALFTTPNADFNVLFKNPSPNGLRHYDHKFEWSRRQFEDWCNNLILRYPAYKVWINGIAKGPEGTEMYGCCSQIAVFCRIKERTAAIDFSDFYESVYEVEYPFQTPEEKFNDALEFDVYQFLIHHSKDDKYIVDDKYHIPLSDILPLLTVSCSEERLKEFVEKSKIISSIGIVKTINNELQLILRCLPDEDSSDFDDLYKDEEENQTVGELVFSHVTEPEEIWDTDEIETKNVIEKTKTITESNEIDHHNEFNSDLLDIDCLEMNSKDHEEKFNVPKKSLKRDNLEISLSSSGEQSVVQLKSTVASELKEDNPDCFLKLSSTTPELSKAQFEETLKLSPSSYIGEGSLKNKSFLKDDSSKISCHSGDKNLKYFDNNEQSSSNSLSRSQSLENIDICCSKSKNFRYSLNIDSEKICCDTYTVDMELCTHSITETYSKAVDSGYPNSNQDMDLDLTPEQVDEIITETESSLEDEESSADERVEQIQGNHPVVFVDNVENGDVANNNRDGEGNNMEEGHILVEELVFEDMVLGADEVEAANEPESDDGLYLSALDESERTIIPEEISLSEDTVFLFDLPSTSSADVFLIEQNEVLDASMNGFPGWLLNISVEGNNFERGDAVADKAENSIDSVID